MGYVQHIDGFSSAFSSGQTFAFAGNVVAGNAIVVMFNHSYAGCPPTVTDSQGNTYTSKGTQPSDTNTGNLWIFTAVAGSSAACTITITFSCGFARIFLAVELSSMQADPYDAEAVLFDSASPYGVGVTTAIDGEIVLAMWHKQGSDLAASSVSSPMTFLTNATDYATAIGTQPTAGAITPEITGPAGDILCYTAAFKASAAPAGQPTGRRHGLVPHAAARQILEVGRSGATLMQKKAA